MFTAPAVAMLAAGIVAPICVEPKYCDAMAVPFSATVELDVNPVPVSVICVTVSTGPEFGEICVSVGAGGLVIVTVSALETAGIEAGLLIVMLAVPRSPAGSQAPWL
jgi:hypothetical protein